MRNIFLTAFSLLFFVSSFFSAGAQEMSREDILKYALDSEVSELINTLIEEKNTEYTEELHDLFLRTKNANVKESIFKLFADQKNPVLEEQCVAILQDPYEERKSLVTAAADYAGAVPIPSALPALHSLVDTEIYDYASPAVRAIGKAGTKEDAVFLAGLLDMEFFDDEKQRLVFRQDVMAAISNLDASDIREKLISVVQNEDENVMIRSSAASAIGKLGFEDDVEIFVSLFNETDPVLRTAAIKSLANFETGAAGDIILEGFKDSYYKVRLEALSAAEDMDLKEAVPYVIYRAKTDPVESVKMRSYEVLGKIGGSDGVSFLTEVLKKDDASDKFRAKAADVLLENNFDSSYSDVAEVAEKILPDEKKRWLCHELGKSFAKIENQRTSTMASMYLSSSDVITQNLGLDMYERNRYPSVRETVRELSEKEGAGAIQRRALKILEKETPAAETGTPSAPATGAGGESGGGSSGEVVESGSPAESSSEAPVPESQDEKTAAPSETNMTDTDTDGIMDFSSAASDENMWNN